MEEYGWILIVVAWLVISAIAKAAKKKPAADSSGDGASEASTLETMLREMARQASGYEEPVPAEHVRTAG